MNLFIGIGRIVDASLDGKALRFSLAIRQGEKLYRVPCLVFDPDQETKELVEQLQASEQIVWLQGRITVYEYEYQGKARRKIEVLTYARSIKVIE